MIKDRVGDYATRVCDSCGHEQRVNYWNLVKKAKHLCRYCNNKETGKLKIGKPAHNKGKQYQAKRVGNFYVNGGGYVCLWVGKHTLTKVGGYYLEHRLQMELMLGRSLEAHELVHHIDGDKTNNISSNLVLCAGDFEHQKLHGRLERAAMELVKLGVLVFDFQSGDYIIAPCIREFASESPELLGNPTAGNQQRSLHQLSVEERSTTIQKWSTLKRAEAGDNFQPTSKVDDIVCSAQECVAGFVPDKEIAGLVEQ